MVEKTGSDTKEVVLHREFGGPIGALGLMLFSHVVLYYFWISQQYYQGALLMPDSVDDAPAFVQRMINHVKEGAAPTEWAAKVYLGFLAFQALLGLILPGITVKGLPIVTENGKSLIYLCNAVTVWWVTLALVFGLNYTGVFRLSLVADNFGPLMTSAVLFADAFSVFLYLFGIVSGKAIRMSGNPIYDFFMGSMLNPRLFHLDIKMWAEVRMSWILLFLLTASAGAKQFEETGRISPSLIFMMTAHFLYTNACAKGEECIPYTFDIFYEKFGWMLIFWNLAGVPFLYCFQSFYILRNNVEFENPLGYYALFFALFTSYYVWDTAQSQKARFRMQLRGNYKERWTFPQLPWGTLQNPQYIKTENGGTLLVDGWFKYARKIYYLADFVMAMTWGLSCGVSGALPFFYPLFFGTMLTHRYSRDISRCKQKYGKDWDKYCQKVPYALIPYVF